MIAPTNSPPSALRNETAKLSSVIPALFDYSTCECCYEHGNDNYSNKEWRNFALYQVCKEVDAVENYA